uniref:Reverse transcriptase domain-containing protein n=1 Tax=Magallana gigas TaxID=29159 RepID=A0A8W8L8P9_MAGGI
MATIMYNVGKERFGLEEIRQKQQQSTGHRNRRQQERASIRRDLRQLSKRYRVAPEEERAALAELRQGMRERLKILNRAERSRKRRKERARARARFTANPFQFTSKLLGKKRSGMLLAEKAEVEQHLKEVHSEEKRDEELPEQPKLMQVCEPEHIFDESELTAKEVRYVIRKARAASAPGPNGIPYQVYKNCPRMTRRLWKHIRVIWRRGRLADSWNQAEGCYIPKEENSKNLSQFRTISLLNVEGKILLSVMANRMTRYMLDNNYVDVAVQKGGVPAKTRHLLEEYFNRLELRFSIGDYTTSWQRLEVGIVTGCTISVILFAAAMNLLVKSAEKMSRGPWMRAGIRQPSVRAFMDDMTISTKTAVEAGWTLKEIEELISWSRMKIKPSKSKSLVPKKGRVTNYDFQLGQEIIPSVSEKPVKCPGKYFDNTLRDT